MIKNGFPKNERLSLRKDIDRLFDSGQSFVSYPMRIVFLRNACNRTSDAGLSVLVSVPKKRMRLAVNRNRIKRLIREAVRLNKNATVAYCKQQMQQLHIAFMYMNNDLLAYAVIEKAVLKALNTICGTENDKS